MFKLDLEKADRAPPPEPPEPLSRGPARRGNGETGGAVTCREWDLGSGGLKKESGSFRSLMGTVCGTLAVLGFMTALKSASRSVSESPRTCTIWWPAGGACGAAGGPVRQMHSPGAEAGFIAAVLEAWAHLRHTRQLPEPT